MKVVVKPKQEAEILASTTKSSSTEEVREALIRRLENKPQSRCGCGTCS